MNRRSFPREDGSGVCECGLDWGQLDADSMAQELLKLDRIQRGKRWEGFAAGMSNLLGAKE